MKAVLQRVGNSHGIIIPKPILKQIGFEREVDLEVQADAIVIRKSRRPVREGWTEASQAISRSGDDELVWPEFRNEADSELSW